MRWLNRHDHESIRALRRARPDFDIIREHGHWSAYHLDALGGRSEGAQPLTGDNARQLSAAIRAAWAQTAPGRHR